ncbi:hypothetical protein HLV35_02950 [Eggerthellaceae bacterium zg-997]|nr:hypothetical protein [Eggerthellaceae bacterium zg-997]
MLFVVTGEVQTGKTRWIERLVGDLDARGVVCRGVVAPGVWRVVEGESERGSVVREKLGIDNVLLPQGSRVPFALRCDLAQRAGSFDEESQAARARLRWAIDDAAIAQVNRHLADLRARPSRTPGLLVLDELGRLELLRNQGLTEALALLDAGASPALPHALVVVRADLLGAACAREWDAVWGGLRAIGPTDEARAAVLDCFSRAR